jgi:hypothetical protein
MRASLPILVLGTLAMAIGCGGTDPAGLSQPGTRTDGGVGPIDTDGGIFVPTDPTTEDGGGPDLGGPVTTCAQAAAAKAYVGCDFWPTPVANAVWSIFDFAAVVANASASTVTVTVQGPNGFNTTAQVAPNALQPLYLPWVPALKGGDQSSTGVVSPITRSVTARGGAYHLTSNAPITVYQFNAIQYRGQGGPAGKSWASCPGGTIGCFSYTNDASLLLPSTAMTGNYRIVGAAGDSSYFAVTSTADNTTVRLSLASGATVLAGTGINEVAPGGLGTYSLNKGDVIEVFVKPRPVGPFGPPLGSVPDFSGSLITASNPIQVLAGAQCLTVPEGVSACDHVEESVFPAETLGKDYVVTVPTGPNGVPVGQVVRLVGNVDGTALTWSGGRPSNAPTTINAGQVIDLGRVNTDFRVTGDKAFGLATLMLGGSVVDAQSPAQSRKGDPSMSFPSAVEQYRDSYIFLAPTDYDVSYVDIVYPPDGEASLKLDGAAVGGTGVDITGSGFKVKRVKLGAGNSGAHTLTADKAFGIQVSGYGAYTSYQYPGGLNLKRIAPPPIR